MEEIGGNCACFACASAEALELCLDESEDEVDGLGLEVVRIEGDVLWAGVVELQAFEVDGEGGGRGAAERHQAGGDDDRIEADGEGGRGGVGKAEMNAETDVERAAGGAGDGGDVAAAEVDQREMELEGGGRGRSVCGVELAGKAEGDTGSGVDGEIGIAARLIAEQWVPGFVCGQVGERRGGQQCVQDPQKGGALGVVFEDGLDVGERVLKPMRLEVASIVEEAYRFAKIEDFVAEAVAHAAPPGALVRPAPAWRLSFPAAAERARGVILRSEA